MGLRVAVIGAAGYAGGELLRLLSLHPEVEDFIATSRSQAGMRMGEVHPALAGISEATFSGASPAEAAARRDVVFLALEHGESSKIATEVLNSGVGLVIDLAADFRVQDLALYQKFYGVHTAPDLVRCFTYGLADVLGTSLRGKRAVAVPGCFATAAELALYPLARAGISSPPALFAVTGSSGAGALPKATTHHPARAHNLFAYSTMGHRHEAEIAGCWGEWTGDRNAGVRLMAHSGPFVRGIYLSTHVQLGGDQKPRKDMSAWYRTVYEGRPFVRVLNQPPELTHAVGTNYALIHAAQSDDGRELQVSVAIDNLVKGASGQAIQAMNLALGLPEELGLRGGGIFPC
ncbi:MAG TPA: N-acetyl-gamma-glutamyl-phosphate reductase [Gemmatimonadales bacterium]|jgi:N-acetyl-gamma-glutamyl-phosphate reductase